MTLNIKAVAELTGVPLHTLRAWERRYGIPRPDRNAENRYRLYDDQDIADVLWMKRQVEAGVSPAQASAMLRQSAHPTIAQSALPQLAGVANALYDALAARDESAAHRILNEAWSAYAPEQVILEVIQPTMHRIGDSWQRNLLSVEQEHFASNLMRQRLHALMQAQPAPVLSAPRLVAACAPEEQHDLGLLILALLAKRQGWNVEYLGQRTPLDDLRNASEHARYIVLSVSTVNGLASLLPLWTESLPPAPILFGGEIFNWLPRLREHVPGAFVGDDAVQAMRNLATSAPRAPDWKPEADSLNAAVELASLRLQIAGGTVALLSNNRRPAMEAITQYRSTMSQSALFLTDALCSALAFDVPELMQAHGVWLYELLLSHRVPAPAVHHFLNAYHASLKRFVSKAHAKRMQILLTQFRAAVDAQSETAEG